MTSNNQDVYYVPLQKYQIQQNLLFGKMDDLNPYCCQLRCMNMNIPFLRPDNNKTVDMPSLLKHCHQELKIMMLDLLQEMDVDVPDTDDPKTIEQWQCLLFQRAEVARLIWQMKTNVLGKYPPYSYYMNRYCDILNKCKKGSDSEVIMKLDHDIIADITLLDKAINKLHFCYEKGVDMAKDLLKQFRRNKTIDDTTSKKNR